ncbi:MAG TPA: branched-chain amino acid ABC transporter permease, partial [Bacillota bacterium]|nr:branched-chain amino acid ABC transporter permease [Bacillota bacterium]
FINLIREFLRSLLGVEVSFIQVVVLLVSIVLMFLLNYIVNYTKTGKAMRAVSHDRNAAYLMGINVDGIISFTFAIGTALAAAAGILFASAYPQIEPNMGIIPGLKAFIAAVLGGIGSIPGAMIGGYIMGIAETLTKGFISSKLADAIAFSILIIILVVKPSGIMGKNVSEKV